MSDEVIDILRLHALQVDYARRVDDFDAEGLADLFTVDGVLDASGIGLPQIVGREALIAYMAGRFANIAHTIHVMSNHRITRIVGDEAEGFCYFTARTHLRGGDKSEFAGRYDDRYRRGSAGWKIERRRLVELLPTILG